MADGVGPLAFPPIEQMTHAQLLAAAADPNWRIRNLYYIIDKDGQRVLFKPWPEQEKLLTAIWYRNLILKARQLGFSTLIQLMMLDATLFTPNIRAAIIAHDKDSATKIFRDKLVYAYDNLPAIIQDMVPIDTKSKTEIKFANNSAISVATSARSGTLQWLHISEFGKICAKYPQKAREIVTGSLPALAATGIGFIESTAEGREGSFYAMTQQAMKTDQLVEATSKALTIRDYRFHFASWLDNPEYEIDPAGVIIQPKDIAYFRRLEAALGRDISAGQRAWYVQTRDVEFQGDPQMMRQEYPSTPEEAFEATTEGLILGEQLARARIEGRVTTVPYDARYPVNTFWDLGLNDEMVVWCHQRVGLRDHWIDCAGWEGEPYAVPVAWLNERNYYLFGRHYLPHDGKKRNMGVFELPHSAQMLAELGLKNIEVVARIPNVVEGYQLMRNDFTSYWFDEERCGEGLAHLGDYRKVWNERTGTYSTQPLHNRASNWADALRQKAQGFIPFNEPQRRKRRVSGMAA